ncbi:MAG: S-layer homology domain-containing protein [Clostridia bacterium]|nr:S-layer homology domain-containing protein [Clostridia bacterium]
MAPGRDFYVIGKITRDNSAANEPLDFLIELIDEKGGVVRSLQSDVGETGVTPNDEVQTYYLEGYALGDSKGSNILNYAPPDLIYDGIGNASIRYTCNKIVVREKYFAAVIYGGATKYFDISYVDEKEQIYEDIPEGEYTLKITILNSDGEEVGTAEKELTFGTDETRFIFDDNDFADDEKITEYVAENAYTVMKYIPGYWNPDSFLGTRTGFTYTIASRFRLNIEHEMENSEAANLFLHALDSSNSRFNFQWGSLLKSENEPKIIYSYYDIGESEVEFNFASYTLKKSGTIETTKDNSFVKILRVEIAHDDESNYADFDLSDGLVFTERDDVVLYGVYSPVEPSSNYVDGVYTFSDSASYIKAVFRDEVNNTVYETKVSPYLIRTDDLNREYKHMYEFSIEVDASDLKQTESLFLTVYVCDSDGEILAESDKITCSLKGGGKFISGYSDTYWGKSFCDAINLFGESADGEPLDADDVITRGDFAAMINRVFGYAATGRVSFKDIDSDSAYYADVVTASKIGYMTGDENSEIHADDAITREEAIIILSRICDADESIDELDFEDNDLISFWAEDAVKTMVATGIISGYGGYLNPLSNITVAESAALIGKTLIWIYSDKDDEISIPQNDIGESEENVVFTDLSEASVASASFEGEITYASLGAIMNENEDTFELLKDYILEACPYGLYVRKVGSGVLEVRDYRMGESVSLSDDALSLLIEMSELCSSFMVKYNPTDGNVYFAIGRNDDNKEFGIAYSPEGEASGRDFEEYSGDWYFYAVQ